jgi:hypothetical protein
MSELFKTFSKPVRRLGDNTAVASKVHDGNAIETSRDLFFGACDFKYSSWKPGCGGQRGRRLQSTAACSANITKFNNVLSDLRSSSPKLSSACKAYIGPVSSRTFSCREIMDCNIKAIAQWNADTNDMHTAVLPPTGTQICSTSQPNFQAVIDFDVGDVTFVLIKPDGTTYTRRESDAPYFSFGNTGLTNIYKYSGDFDLGTYTLTAVPLMAPTKSVTVKFEIVNCEV